METVLVNRADWWTPPNVDVPEDWKIVNAPRPLLGPLTWTGEFRHGVFFAAGPADDEVLARSWKADDAWPVEFIDNAEVERRVMAKLAEYETTLEEVGLTVAELAYDMCLPWHEEDAA